MPRNKPLGGLWAALPCLTTLFLAGPALADFKISVGQVRVGFPAKPQGDDSDLTSMSRQGAWAPVFVDIEAGPEGLKGTEGNIDIVVEGPDASGTMTRYKVTASLPQLGPNEPFTVATYTKLANDSDNEGFTVTVWQEGRKLAQSDSRQVFRSTLDANRVLYLALGADLANLRKALKPKDKEADYREIAAYQSRAEQLPDRWFGYEGVDLVLLTTGSKAADPGSFMHEFTKPENHRRRMALVDWVRRGGQLVVSVGRNTDVVAAIEDLRDLLPVRLIKPVARKELTISWPDSQVLASGKEGTFDVATWRIQENRNAQVLLADDKGQALIVQAPFGMGRVTVVAFDLDRTPFSSWPGQNEFWLQLLNHAWAREAALAKPTAEGEIYRGRAYSPDYEEGNQTELLARVQASLEDYGKEVPVISFGWVALFIFLYILVVGPLDYFFLKKVVKRLEWTWITFPAVVLVVSVLAYFTAYYLKGSDLRVNKVDLVDIDLASGRTYGHTWFTIFSPRIDNYTVGLEPAPEWAGPPPQDAPPEVVMSWLSRPEPGGFGQGRMGSVFRRAYDYEANAAGLHDMPIQVWSTKSFMASWEAPSPGQPAIRANLKDPEGKQKHLLGTITWLPAVDPVQHALGLSFQGDTLTVGQVEADGPAQKAGVQAGDVILRFNGLPVSTRKDLIKEMKGLPSTIPLEIRRDGKSLQVAVPVSSTLTFTAQLIYRGQVYLLSEGLLPGVPFELDKTVPGDSVQMASWLQHGDRFPLEATMRMALFHEAFVGDQNNPADSNMRDLDQWWRVKPAPEGRTSTHDEAILVGRLVTQHGPAEEVSKNLVSSCRLWLGAIPGKDESRPALPGKLRQDTFIRVFIPVKTEPGKDPPK